MSAISLNIKVFETSIEKFRVADWVKNQPYVVSKKHLPGSDRAQASQFMKKTEARTSWHSCMDVK